MGEGIKGGRAEKTNLSLLNEGLLISSNRPHKTLNVQRRKQKKDGTTETTNSRLLNEGSPVVSSCPQPESEPEPDSRNFCLNKRRTVQWE